MSARPSVRTKAPVSSERPAKIRVLVADDHAIVLEGLVAMLGRQPDMEVVAQASNGREAVQEWRAHRPDVMLVDLRMPILDGVGVITAIRAEDPNSRVIVLTTYDTDEEIFQAVKAGARAYLLKDARREELLEVIVKVHAGQTFYPQALAAKLAERISGPSLTGRELDVLTLLAAGKSNREIGVNLYISESTVKSHLKSIFGKLNVISRSEAVATAIKRGIVQ